VLFGDRGERAIPILTEATDANLDETVSPTADHTAQWQPY
jgi:hypothetical protein